MDHFGKVDDFGGQIDQQAECTQLVDKHRQQEIRSRLFLHTDTVVLVLEVLNNIASSETVAVVGGSLHQRRLGKLVEKGCRSSQGNGASNSGLSPERRRRRKLGSLEGSRVGSGGRVEAWEKIRRGEAGMSSRVGGKGFQGGG